MQALPQHEGMYCRHWIHWHCLDQARDDAAGQAGTGSPLCPGCWPLGRENPWEDETHWGWGPSESATYPWRGSDTNGAARSQ